VRHLIVTVEMPKKEPKEPKQIFLESAGGNVGDRHYDQVIDETGTKNFFVVYRNGKIVDRPTAILIDQTPKLEIYAVPYRRGIYPFNFNCKNLEPEKYGDVIDLFNEIKKFHYAHWDYHDKAFYDIMAAWTLATYLPEKWMAIAYLAFIGDKGTGKSRGMESQMVLSYRGWLMTAPNEATIFRVVTDWHPTIMIDESEVITTSDRSTVQNLLNAGQRRGVGVARQEQITKGRYYTRLFELFGFKSLAGTRMWLGTLQRRSLIAYMTKNVRKVKRFIDLDWATKIRRKLLQYRIDYIDVKFTESQPKIDDLTEVLSGGIYELFFSLFSVTPSEKWNSLLKYALKEQRAQKESSSTSDLAEIFFAILELRADTILISEIVVYLNQDRAPKEQFTNREVSKLVSVVGLGKKHTKRGTAVIWNNDVIERLKNQYGIDERKGDGVTESKRSKTDLSKIFDTDRS